MAEINFEAKTDRELLLLVAQDCNTSKEHLEKINGTLKEQSDVLVQHDGRITKVESRMKLNWRSVTLLTTFLAMVIMELGNLVHWW
jgi:Leucine-rich repeat (LRR) protein